MEADQLPQSVRTARIVEARRALTRKFASRKAESDDLRSAPVKSLLSQVPIAESREQFAQWLFELVHAVAESKYEANAQKMLPPLGHNRDRGQLAIDLLKSAIGQKLPHIQSLVNAWPNPPNWRIDFGEDWFLAGLCNGVIWEYASQDDKSDALAEAKLAEEHCTPSAEAIDESAFRPAKEFLGQHGIRNATALSRFLDKHPKIRTMKPNSRRRSVHAGDWQDYWSTQSDAQFEALDDIEQAHRERERTQSEIRKKTQERLVEGSRLLS